MTTTHTPAVEALSPQSGTDDLAPGSVVVVRDEEWLVRATEDTADGLLLHVQGLGELVRDTTASFYTSIDDVVTRDPAKARIVGDDSPGYRRSRLWLEATIRKTPLPLADETLSVATQGLADSLSYQLSAVRKALDPANLRPRILLADAVGLGKTLEIGMILAELVRRGRGERILVVTPRHVLEQMQHELWTRFALPFVRLDSTGIQRVRQQLPATRNPFTYFKRVIISIDTLKSDRYVANLSKQRWDAVVIDESHNLANAATLNNRLGRLLARNSEALILASATPHNGRKDSFAELVRMLEPSAVLPDGELSAGEAQRLVVRRHRHSPEVAGVVGADWAERQEPNNVLVPASPAEDAIATELEEVWLFPRGGTSPYSGKAAGLFPWTLAKAFLSSPAALEQTITARLKRLGDDPAARAEVAALRRLLELTEEALGSESAKYSALLAHLREIGVGRGSPERAVIFAERVATLHWLQEKLTKDLGLGRGAVAAMHGGLADEEQQDLVAAFKQESAKVRVLVTGDVASEGVNLHSQCHELIHYDIPWSLIRIEQRNGRIDRYGQQHPPRITALLLTPSSSAFAGDLRVLARLIDKENEAHLALGDAASLMGKYDVRGEEDAIREVLSRRKDLDDVVREPGDVAEANDDAAFFAQLFDSPSNGSELAPAVTEAATGTGLYARDVNFLAEALQEAFDDPSNPPDRNGVGWRLHEGHGTAELVPPPDLAQRLTVLPQSYLKDRRVTERLVLATTPARGKDRLQAALADDVGSSWPDAHYLAPLHPVLDWAADQALAELGRGEVFAVRGPVDDPTVLLLGTLTNRRGQVVTASWLSVTFPAPETPGFAIVSPFASNREALAALGWSNHRHNPGPVTVTPELQALMPHAVAQARSHLEHTSQAATEAITRRVQQWSRRLDDWEAEAEALVQRSEVRQHRISVAGEREMVEAMTPERSLVRPLLVVVAEEKP